MTVTLLPILKPRTTHKPYIILAILQVLDVTTTGWILYHFSHASEANPIVAAIFTNIGLAIGLVLLSGLKFGVVYLFWVCQTGVKVANFIYSAVLLNNLLFLFLWAAS